MNFVRAQSGGVVDGTTVRKMIILAHIIRTGLFGRGRRTKEGTASAERFILRTNCTLGHVDVTTIIIWTMNNAPNTAAAIGTNQRGTVIARAIQRRAPA